MPHYEPGPGDSIAAADEAYGIGVKIAELAIQTTQLGDHFSVLAILLAMALAEADLLAGAPPVRHTITNGSLN